MVSVLLTACSTVSFAPPEVDTYYSGRVESRATCDFQRNRNGQKMVEITPDVSGALRLADNYEAVYRCATHTASDGRQIFEVPALLALVTAGLGSSFGLTDDGRLAAAGGALLYNRANSYYAPQQKAGMLDSALDAVTCVKNAAVGVDFFETRDPAPVSTTIDEVDDSIEQVETVIAAKSAQYSGLLEFQKSSGEDMADLIAAQADQIDEFTAMRDALIALRANAILQAGSDDEPLTIHKQTDGGTIKVDVRRQYFQIVAGGLSQIDQVLGRRLRAAGTVIDPQGLATELQALEKQEQEIEDQQEEAANAAINSAGAKMQRDGSGLLTFSDDPAKESRLIELGIDQLQVQIGQCVARAKL